MSTSAHHAEVEVRGERLFLLPERAVFWPARHTLLVADPHWGKAASFRALGVAAPGGTTLEGVHRLGRALRDTRAQRLVFLGDFFHARTSRTSHTLASLSAWRAEHAALKVVLVRGNHDRGAGDPPPELRIECVDAPLLDVPFALHHHPTPDAGGYTLAGHLHPAVRLVGSGRQRARLACFWFGAEVGVLPAFGAFTGALQVVPSAGDGVFVVADGEVVRVSDAAHA